MQIKGVMERANNILLKIDFCRQDRKTLCFFGFNSQKVGKFNRFVAWIYRIGASGIKWKDEAQSGPDPMPYGIAKALGFPMNRDCSILPGDR